MKTHRIQFAAFCSCFLLLTSCNKDDSTPPASTQKNPIEQLRAFRQQIETFKGNPNLRSQETMPLDEALWDIENHFNLTYSDPEQYYAQTNKHEFTLTLPLNAENQVLVNQAVDLYGKVIQKARQALSSDDFESKGMISLHIDEITQEDEGIALKFEAKTGERSAYNPPVNLIDGPFGPEDNWMFASPMGKCDDPDIPSGADIELQEKLFDNLIGILPDENPRERNIFVNRKTFIFDGHDYAGVYINYDDEDLCIPYTQMNQLYSTEKHIITHTIPEQYHLYDYQPISIIICGTYLEDYRTHLNEIEYGQLYRVSVEEFGTVEDLLQP